MKLGGNTNLNCLAIFFLSISQTRVAPTANKTMMERVNSVGRFMRQMDGSTTYMWNSNSLD